MDDSMPKNSESQLLSLIDKYGIVTFQCFTHEQVKEINKEIKKTFSKKENPLEGAKYATKKGNFSLVPCLPLMELVHPWLYQCQQANKDVFGYDIDWHFHLDRLNYNVYGTTDEYDWHVDADSRITQDMKLTCLLNLSEESYEGGEFYVINYKEKIKFDSGMGLVLTSLIAHKVTPITKGERISLTYWGYGPSWR